MQAETNDKTKRKMKKLFTVALSMLMMASVQAKDIKTLVVTTTPVMHCEGCENKIKNALRFEKGIKEVKTDIPKQEVTIKYDADKINGQKIWECFQKVGFDIKLVDKKKAEKK